MMKNRTTHLKKNNRYNLIGLRPAPSVIKFKQLKALYVRSKSDLTFIKWKQLRESTNTLITYSDNNLISKSSSIKPNTYLYDFLLGKYQLIKRIICHIFNKSRIMALLIKNIKLRIVAFLSVIQLVMINQHLSYNDIGNLYKIYAALLDNFSIVFILLILATTIYNNGRLNPFIGVFIIYSIALTLAVPVVINTINIDSVLCDTIGYYFIFGRFISGYTLLTSPSDDSFFSDSDEEMSEGEPPRPPQPESDSEFIIPSYQELIQNSDGMEVGINQNIRDEIIESRHVWDSRTPENSSTTKSEDNPSGLGSHSGSIDKAINWVNWEGTANIENSSSSQAPLGLGTTAVNTENYTVNLAAILHLMPGAREIMANANTTDERLIGDKVYRGVRFRGFIGNAHNYLTRFSYTSSITMKGLASIDTPKNNNVIDIAIYRNGNIVKCCNGHTYSYVVCQLNDPLARGLSELISKASSGHNKIVLFDFNHFSRYGCSSITYFSSASRNFFLHHSRCINNPPREVLAINSQAVGPGFNFYLSVKTHVDLVNGNIVVKNNGENPVVYRNAGGRWNVWIPVSTTTVQAVSMLDGFTKHPRPLSHTWCYDT